MLFVAVIITVTINSKSFRGTIVFRDRLKLFEYSLCTIENSHSKMAMFSVRKCTTKQFAFQHTLQMIFSLYICGCFVTFPIKKQRLKNHNHHATPFIQSMPDKQKYVSLLPNYQRYTFSLLSNHPTIVRTKISQLLNQFSMI